MENINITELVDAILSEIQNKDTTYQQNYIKECIKATTEIIYQLGEAKQYLKNVNFAQAEESIQSLVGKYEVMIEQNKALRDELESRLAIVEEKLNTSENQNTSQSEMQNQPKCNKEETIKINFMNFSHKELISLAAKLNISVSEVFTRSEESVRLRNQIFNLIEKYPDSQTCLYDIERTYLHFSPNEVLSLKTEKYQALYDYSGEVLCLVTQPVETLAPKPELSNLSIILRKEIKNLSKNKPTLPTEMQ